jgi:hypothetical protein
MPHSLSWAKKLLPGAVAVAAAVVAAAAPAADAAGEAVAVAAAAEAAGSPGVYPEAVATPVRRIGTLTALMKQLMEAGFCVTRPLFLSAAWCYRERGERYPRVVITGIDRLWRAPNNDAPAT